MALLLIGQLKNKNTNKNKTKIFFFINILFEKYKKIRQKFKINYKNINFFVFLLWYCLFGRKHMDAYYKKIVYKKNAFDDLKTYIKIHFSNKKILLVSTKSVPAENVTSLLNALFCGSESVLHFVGRNNFDELELNDLKAKIFDSDLVIAFGGGRCCDVVKFFCHNFNLPYIVCPSAATSISYFTSYCINPYDSSKSFYAKMPNKIFIQEDVIKKSSCSTNIVGLCFLQSLRALFVEGVLNDNYKERFIFMGMEKLFAKLDREETNILLCNEDSNLVLMDLFIDFGFFMGMFVVEDYYLINMFCIYQKINNRACGGGEMLLCAKAILEAMGRFLHYGCVRVFEVPNYKGVEKLIKNYKIFAKKIKNNIYFNSFWQKVCLKVDFLNNKQNNFKLINFHLKTIDNFVIRVKNVYKKGLNIGDVCQSSLIALAIAPYMCGETAFVDYMAGSGIFNSIIYGECV